MMRCIYGVLHIGCNIFLAHCIFGALYLWCYLFSLLVCYALASLVLCICTFGMLCIGIFGGASLVRLLVCNASLVHCFWSWVQYIFGVAFLVLCIVSYIAQACYRSGASTVLTSLGKCLKMHIFYLGRTNLDPKLKHNWGLFFSIFNVEQLFQRYWGENS